MFSRGRQGKAARRDCKADRMQLMVSWDSISTTLGLREKMSLDLSESDAPLHIIEPLASEARLEY